MSLAPFQECFLLDFTKKLRENLPNREANLSISWRWQNYWTNLARIHICSLELNSPRDGELRLTFETIFVVHIHWILGQTFATVCAWVAPNMKENAIASCLTWLAQEEGDALPIHTAWVLCKSQTFLVQREADKTKQREKASLPSRFHLESVWLCLSSSAGKPPTCTM